MKNKTNIKLLISLLICLLFSCNTKTPKGIIFPKKMIAVSEELHLLDAMLTNNNLDKSEEEIMKYYQYIYEKNNVTQAQFDSSIIYYSQNPKPLRKAYEEVLKNLATKDSLIKANEKVQTDTIQLWKGLSSYKIEEYTTQTFPISLPVEYQKNYTISAEIKIYEDSQIKEIKPFFSFVAPDTTYILPSMVIQSDTIFHKFEITQMVTDSLITVLKGDFFPPEKDSVELFKHYEIRNIKITTTELSSNKELKKLSTLMQEQGQE